MKTWNITAADLTFGFEIECNMPNEAVQHYGLEVGGYHRPVKHQFPEPVRDFGCQSDSSIPWVLNHTPGEWASPVLKGAEGIAKALEFTSFLRDIRANPQGCGVHVHVGLASILGRDVANAEEREEYLRRLCNVVGFHEKAFYASSGTRYRERSSWCKPIKSQAGVQLKAAEVKRQARRFGQVSRTNNGDRYSLLNLTRVYDGRISNRAKTVEFRCWAGTVDPVRIAAYVQMALAACQKAAVEINSGGPWDSYQSWNWTGKSYKGAEAEVAVQRFLRSHGWTPSGKQLGWIADFSQYGKAVRSALLEQAAAYEQSASLRP